MRYWAEIGFASAHRLTPSARSSAHLRGLVGLPLALARFRHISPACNSSGTRNCSYGGLDVSRWKTLGAMPRPASVGSRSKCEGRFKDRESWCSLWVPIPGRRRTDMSYHQLSRGERYIIAFCLKRGESKLAIARMINRHPSTIYREVRRNFTRHDGWYRALIADWYAVARRHRGPKGSRFSDEEWGLVRALLERKLSPEQVSGLLREQGILSISHETIYQYIFEDRR